MCFTSYRCVSLANSYISLYIEAAYDTRAAEIEKLKIK